jgi:hypothetical protein
MSLRNAAFERWTVSASCEQDLYKAHSSPWPSAMVMIYSPDKGEVPRGIKSPSVEAHDTVVFEKVGR